MRLQAVSLGEGSNMREDIIVLKRCPHIVVGTPDRVGQLIKKGYLKSQDVRCISINKSDQANQDKCKQEYHMIKL